MVAYVGQISGAVRQTARDMTRDLQLRGSSLSRGVRDCIHLISVKIQGEQDNWINLNKIFDPTSSMM